VKPYLVKYFKWFLGIIKEQRAHYVIRPDHKAPLPAQRAECPWVRPSGEH